MGSSVVEMTLAQKIYIIQCYYRSGECTEQVKEDLKRRYEIELCRKRDADLLAQVKLLQLHQLQGF